ncbi:hypothetical protein M422DRAFT_52711 [Sphaerobolus stellatus SS14]|uniref:Uncharacterized protein n=1 Tax=Sphaerobolus stellatus (strain SS14) TaxID=990650 RepID=A0A0C9V5S1_SPHS4|nr:hypothetical protein M422DRAFT_52711 [Sphaerobolus stellatus SS14]
MPSPSKNPPAGDKLKSACTAVAKDNSIMQYGKDQPPFEKICDKHSKADQGAAKAILPPRIGYHNENAGRYYQLCTVCSKRVFRTSKPDETQQTLIEAARVEEANELVAEKEEIAQRRKEIREQVKIYKKELEEKAGLGSKMKKKIAATADHAKALDCIPSSSSSSSCPAPRTLSSKLAASPLTPPRTPLMVKSSGSKHKRDTAKAEVIDLTVDDDDGPSMPKRRKMKHSKVEVDDVVIID